MNYTTNSEDYKKICQEIYHLILDEYEKVEDIETQYPKFVIMLEFFRFLRGEAFTKYREPTPDFQKNLYQMEDNLTSILRELKTKLDPNSDRLSYNIAEVSKLFRLI